jgi:hypothetical protein
VEALLDPRQLEPLGPGRYRYTVTRVQVFQLQIQPIVELQVRHQGERLELSAIDCQLEGLGLVEDFRLTLDSWLAPRPQGLEGEASLAVSVSRPSLLRLIPPKVLEATGRSLLGGILLGIRTRVSQQLLGDYRRWCACNEAFITQLSIGLRNFTFESCYFFVDALALGSDIDFYFEH